MVCVTLNPAGPRNPMHTYIYIANDTNNKSNHYQSPRTIYKHQGPPQFIYIFNSKGILISTPSTKPKVNPAHVLFTVSPCSSLPNHVTTRPDQLWKMEA